MLLLSAKLKLKWNKIHNSTHNKKTQLYRPCSSRYTFDIYRQQRRPAAGRTCSWESFKVSFQFLLRSASIYPQKTDFWNHIWIIIAPGGLPIGSNILLATFADRARFAFAAIQNHSWVRFCRYERFFWFNSLLSFITSEMKLSWNKFSPLLLEFGATVSTFHHREVSSAFLGENEMWVNSSKIYAIHSSEMWKIYGTWRQIPPNVLCCTIIGNKYKT